ncbi:MAG TPA: hypothetical protein VJ745_05060 [Gaiellaceae bacterium]|nr:hypothetical protein [Gaiellaceae bacterium]
MLALAALLGVGGSASAASNAKPRVTVICDSVAESFDHVASARRYLGRGLDVRSDTAVCRRLVAASCMFQGAQPKTALEVVAARSRSLGSVVVVNVGGLARLLRPLVLAGLRGQRPSTARLARTVCSYC